MFCRSAVSCLEWGESIFIRAIFGRFLKMMRSTLPLTKISKIDDFQDEYILAILTDHTITILY